MLHMALIAFQRSVRTLETESRQLMVERSRVQIAKVRIAALVISVARCAGTGQLAVEPRMRTHRLDDFGVARQTSGLLGRPKSNVARFTAVGAGIIGMGGNQHSRHDQHMLPADGH